MGKSKKKQVNTYKNVLPETNAEFAGENGLEQMALKRQKEGPKDKR